jgi:hypothetical protein
MTVPNTSLDPYDDPAGDSEDARLFDEPSDNVSWRAQRARSVQESVLSKPVTLSVAVIAPTLTSIPPSATRLDTDAERDLKAAQARLGDALPTEGWLAEFVKMAMPMTSSPTEFHLAAAISTISAALGNRIKIRKWNTTIYANVWTIVVAPTGNWHKTTSMNMADELLERSGLVVMLPHDGSREALLQEYGKMPAGLMVFNEFSGFLTSARKDFGQGMVSDLTNLYDSKNLYKRVLRKEEFIVRRPAIGIHAATTIDALEALIAPEDLRSGFYHRFLFVTAVQKNTNRKFSDEVDQAAQDRLIAGLHRIVENMPALDPTSADAAAITVAVTPDADAMWGAWTDELDAEAESGRHPSFLVGFLSRLQVYGLKLAMIYRVSACAFDRSANPLVVDAVAMKSAIAYCKLVWGNAIQLWTQDYAGTKEAQELRHVRDSVIEEGCARSVALRRSGMKSYTFTQNLNTLIETGEIASEEKSAAELGLVRERDKKTQWLSWGDNHPAMIARRRSRPKKVRKAQAWESEWDEGTAKTTPLVLSDRPADRSSVDSATALPAAAPKSA